MSEMGLPSNFVSQVAGAVVADFGRSHPIEPNVRVGSTTDLQRHSHARKAANRYQIAFGHHRLEAARRHGAKSISMVVRDLDDKQMLQFMGRENMEDYNANFLTMLETWEAATNFETGVSKTRKPLETATLLGWRDTSGNRMSPTAAACHAASNLIKDDYLGREDLVELTVKDARELCTRTQERHKQLDKVGKTAKHTPQQVEAGKKQCPQSHCRKTLA